MNWQQECQQNTFISGIVRANWRMDSQLPVIGAPFGRYLRSKAAHVHEKPSTPPGNITALVIYLLSCWRAYKFRKMLCKSQQGYLLITDRYRS
ncbi:nucleoside triphosphate hydrolase domain [Escherichia coli]|uniref:Nucleoside triphosphate hydrolase domain n=1 Tax=Escherichia coli TaxID=562 RepID=A0A376TSI7_ECOLX|nr:nucleoside triphosphate hydrolase domain [Escherichia coli]